MITDALLTLSSAQSIAGSSAVSTNAIDTTTARELVSGTGLGVVFAVDQSVTAAGAATVNFQIITSANANLSSPTVLAQTGPVSKTELTSNRRPFALGLSLGTAAIQGRYLGARFEIANGPLTAGAVSAYLTADRSQAAPIYQSGWSVA